MTTEEIRRIQAEFAAKSPRWTRIGPAAGAPASPSAGADLADTVKCRVRIAPRAEAHRRAARITVAVADGASTYTASAGGAEASYDASGGGGEAVEILDGLASAVSLDPAMGAVVLGVARARRRRVPRRARPEGEVRGGAGLRRDGERRGRGSRSSPTPSRARRASGRRRRARARCPAVGSCRPAGRSARWAGAGTTSGRTPAGAAGGYVEIYDLAGVPGDGAEVGLTCGAWIGPGIAS